MIPLGGSALVLLAALLAFWPRRDAARVPGRRAARADRALRRAGRRAGLRRRVPARRDLHAADGRVPAPGEAAPAGLAGGGRARRRRDARGAGRRARAQPRHALVRLRDVGAGDVVLEVDLVHLEPQLRRAQLAARRPRAAAREGQAAGLLEGREPRRVRRPGLAALGRAGRRRRAPGRRAGDRQALDAADQGLDPQPAHGPVHHRGLRDRARDPEADRHPDARRALRRAAHAAPRRRVHGDGLHAEADRGPAPPRRRRLRAPNLHERLHDDLHGARGRARAPSTCG